MEALNSSKHAISYRKFINVNGTPCTDLGTHRSNVFRNPHSSSRTVKQDAVAYGAHQWTDPSKQGKD